ncbi:hypothetical protein M3Y96_01084000 [Aphelenchoides besseyi]|nr:hypothetical protein M3Y96_01084000 [Aphelenchoides besseyi]
MYIWQRVWDRARRKKVIENEQILHSEWKRRLGVFGLTAIGGVSTLSTVLFVLLPNLFADSGLRAPPLVAVILGVTIHFLSAQQLSFIARILPKNGHLYQFAFVQHSELLAFAIAWSQLLDYLNLLFQGGLNHLAIEYLSGGVVLIAACFMCCSLRILSTSGIVFLIASLFTSLSTSVVAFLHNAVNLRIHNLEIPFELGEIHTGISWLLISFLCCESLSFTSEEADNPRKRLPRMFTALSYGNAVVAIFGTLAFFPFAWRQNFTHTSLIPATFDTIKISSARYLMSCGSVFGLTSALLCSFVAPSRLLFTFSSDDLIPGRKVFASIFGKGGSPRLSVIVTALIASTALMVFVAQFSTEGMSTDTPRYFDFSSRRENSFLQRRDLRSSLGSEFSTPTDDEEETHAMERLWKIDGREETETKSEKQEESKLLKSDNSGSGSSYGSISTINESSLTVAPISVQHHNCLLASCAPPDSKTSQKSRPLTTSSSSNEIGDERAEKRGKRNLTYFIFLSTLIAVSARILWQTQHYVPLLALITLIVSSCLLIGTTTFILKIHRENGGIDRWLLFKCLTSTFLLVQLFCYFSAFHYLVELIWLASAKPRPKNKAGVELGKELAEKSKGLFGQSDWMCTKCGNVNWARRNICNLCNAKKLADLEVRTGFGGGYNDRQNVEYVKRSDNEEFDEFGRKKKRATSSTKEDSTSNDVFAKNDLQSEEDEEDDDDDGDDLGKYDLTADPDLAISIDLSKLQKKDAAEKGDEEASNFSSDGGECSCEEVEEEVKPKRSRNERERSKERRSERSRYDDRRSHKRDDRDRVNIMSNLHFQDFNLGDSNSPFTSVNSNQEFRANTKDTSNLVSNTGVETETTSGNKHHFLSFQFYQQYFDVDTEQVYTRILNSVMPRKNGNFIRDHVQPLPDLYGPFWICVTLVFSAAISANFAHYIESLGKDLYTNDFTLVTGISTLISLYVIIMPFAIYTLLWYRHCPIQYSLVELICAYGFVLCQTIWNAIGSDSNKLLAFGVIAGVMFAHFGCALFIKESYFDTVLPAKSSFETEAQSLPSAAALLVPSSVVPKGEALTNGTIDENAKGTEPSRVHKDEPKKNDGKEEKPKKLEQLKPEMKPKDEISKDAVKSTVVPVADPKLVVKNDTKSQR